MQVCPSSGDGISRPHGFERPDKFDIELMVDLDNKKAYPISQVANFVDPASLIPYQISKKIVRSIRLEDQKSSSQDESPIRQDTHVMRVRRFMPTHRYASWPGHGRDTAAAAAASSAAAS